MRAFGIIRLLLRVSPNLCDRKPRSHLRSGFLTHSRLFVFQQAAIFVAGYRYSTRLQRYDSRSFGCHARPAAIEIKVYLKNARLHLVRINSLCFFAFSGNPEGPKRLTLMHVAYPKPSKRRAISGFNVAAQLAV